MIRYQSNRAKRESESAEGVEEVQPHGGVRLEGSLIGSRAPSAICRLVTGRPDLR